MKLRDWHEMLPLAREILRNHSAGCCWHILLGDGNVDDRDLEFCVTEARRAGHPDCVALIEPMLRSSRTQRAKLYKIV